MSYRLKCGRCARRFESTTKRRRVCDACKPQRQKPAWLEKHLTPGEVDRILSEAVRMECAPAYVRHPIPWD